MITVPQPLRRAFGATLASALLFSISASPAAAVYQDRYEENAYPKNNTDTLYPDPCHTWFSFVHWMECESTAAQPQYHNWTEANITNTGSRSGYVEAWAQASNGNLEEYVWAYGGKGTYAYSNKLPGYLTYPIEGAEAWVAGSSSQSGEWEDTRGKFDN